MPHVVSVVSPYSAAGAVEVSRDRSTAFATVNYDKRANLLPDKTGQPVLTAINAVHVPGLSGGRRRPGDRAGRGLQHRPGHLGRRRRGAGDPAADVRLADWPPGCRCVTAGLGLITGIALVGLATHITDMSNVSPELAIMIGLGVGVDYALFILTRFKENFGRTGDVEASVIEAMDTSGRAILLAGTTVIIALLGMFATGVAFMYGLAIASVLAVLLVLAASLTVLPAMLSAFGAKVARPGRSARRREARRRGPARIGLAALEPDRAVTPVAAGGGVAAHHGAVPDPGIRDAARLQRCRQRPIRVRRRTGRSTSCRPALARASTARC